MLPTHLFRSAIRNPSPMVLAWMAVLCIVTTGWGAEPSRYLRFKAGKTVAYGVLEGERVHELKGMPFAKVERTGNSYPLAEVTILPPTRPTQVLALAGNYSSHLKDGAIPPQFKIPQPFFKSPSCIIGQNQKIILPADSKTVQAEAELVIVIGKRCSKVSVAEAPKYVFGITAGNDVSERIWQNDPQGKDVQWWRAKGADTFGPVGPYIVTGIDYSKLKLKMILNGKVVQEERTDHLIHDIPHVVSFISQYVTLNPGDLIFTGTPGKTSTLNPGDIAEVDLEGVGVLRNPVVAERAKKK